MSKYPIPITTEYLREQRRKADLTNAFIGGIGLGFAIGIIVGHFV